MLTGENGIIAQAKNSKEATEQARVEELVDLAVNSLIGENLGSTNGITPEMIAEEVNKMENRDDVYAEGSTFPTNIIFPEENRKVEVNLTQKEVTNAMYEVAVNEEDIAPMDLFDYEIIDEAEVGALELSELPTKKVRITKIKEEYCTGGKDEDTNYAIIYEGKKISDTLVIPYNVDGKYVENGTEGEIYTITEVQLHAYGNGAFGSKYGFPKVETVIYPNTVEKISGSIAGDYTTTFKTAVWSNRLKIIGDNAFCGCRGLTSIKIPDSVTSIGIQAFHGTNFTTIEIPKSITSIGNRAFSYCENLVSITIPESITSIGDGAFSDCTNLTNIEIPESIISIGDGAFYGCTNLTNIEIPESVTSIGNNAFYGCTNLTNIEIPESVTSIGNNAFCGCTNLTNIEIPESVTSIGNNTFRGCSSLTSITIPDSITSMGEYVFDDWTPSQTINVPFKEGEKSDGWDEYWKSGCDATINYLK